MNPEQIIGRKRYLHAADIEELTHMGPIELRRTVDSGKLPRPQENGLVQRWFAKDVLAWLKARAECSAILQSWVDKYWRAENGPAHMRSPQRPG